MRNALFTPTTTIFHSLMMRLDSRVRGNDYSLPQTFISTSFPRTRESSLKFLKIVLLFLTTMLLQTQAFAGVPTWEIIPTESTLSFTGKLNDAPTSGSFKNFTGEIQFDPNQLDQSNIHMVIEIGSVFTTYQDIAKTLKTPDWFDAIQFPKAIFDAKNFKKVGEGSFTAMGTLTIRDRSLPITVHFTQESLVNNTVKIKGSATIDRTQFNVGQGEWASSEAVGTEVEVNFVITAQKKP